MAGGVIGSVTFTDIGSGGDGDPVVVQLHADGVVSDVSGSPGSYDINLTGQSDAYYGIAVEFDRNISTELAWSVPVKANSGFTLATNGPIGRITVYILRR